MDVRGGVFPTPFPPPCSPMACTLSTIPYFGTVNSIGVGSTIRSLQVSFYFSLALFILFGVGFRLGGHPSSHFDMDIWHVLPFGVWCVRILPKSDLSKKLIFSWFFFSPLYQRHRSLNKVCSCLCEKNLMSPTLYLSLRCSMRSSLLSFLLDGHRIG